MTRPTPPQGDARVTEAMIAALLDLKLEDGKIKGDWRHLIAKWTPRIEAMLDAAPAPTTDEAGTLATWLNEQGAIRGDECGPELAWCENMQRAAALLSRIPSEEATEEEIEAAILPTPYIPTVPWLIKVFAKAGLRITRTPGGQT